MRKRKNRVVVYFNDRELEKLNRMVERTVLSREQFIRDMLLDPGGAARAADRNDPFAAERSRHYEQHDQQNHIPGRV